LAQLDEVVVMKAVERLIGNDGLEVFLSESWGGGTAITIFANTPEAIARVVMSLFDQYGSDDFTQPEFCADGKWGSFGRL
jgi:hypothetical protein